MSDVVTPETKESVNTAIRNDIDGADSALKKIGLAAAVAAVTAIANVLTAAVPDLTTIVVHSLPVVVQPHVGTIVTTGILGIIAALSKWAGKDTKKAVATAYVSEPSAKVARDIKEMYTGTGDGSVK